MQIIIKKKKNRNKIKIINNAKEKMNKHKKVLKTKKVVKRKRKNLLKQTLIQQINNMKKMNFNDIYSLI